MTRPDEQPAADHWLDQPDRESQSLCELAERVLKDARRHGCDQAEVSLSSSLGREAAVRMGEIETLEEASEHGLRVTVYRGQCSGTASTGDLRRETIDQCLDRAIAIAGHTQPDRAAGLAAAELMAGGGPDLDCWHPVDLALTGMVDRAREIEAAGLAADARIVNSEGASVSLDASLAVYANSHGFVGHQLSTRYGQNCVLIAADGEAMQRDYDWDSKRCFEDLKAADEMGREAARRSLGRLGSRRVPTGPKPVLFLPEVASGLLAHLVSAVSGGNLYRRTSFLVDSLGQSLLPSWVSLIEEPRRPRAPGSALFDDDGVATVNRALIDQGVLSRYVLSAYSARRLGLETTANAGGVRNLRLHGGKAQFSDLLAKMDSGLVVAEVMGQGVNLVTGDYSRGASGFWVEGGRMVWPVEEITIAGNLRDMLAGLVAAGVDADDRRNIQTGSLLIDRMMIAGQS